MFDKNLLMYRGGVRSFKRTLADGKEHTLHYKARTPAELASYLGQMGTLGGDEPGLVAQQKLMAKFITDSMCDEAGEKLFTLQEAEMVTGTLKRQICEAICVGSNQEGAAGND